MFDIFDKVSSNMTDLFWVHFSESYFPRRVLKRIPRGLGFSV